MVTSPATPGLIQRLIGWSAYNPLLTLLLILASAVWGWRALLATPLDAVPDLSDVQVIISTEWSGRSPDLVEDQVTYLLTTRFLAAPKVREVRGQSAFGLSFVYVIFEDGTDPYWARSRVLEYLSTARASLPEDAQPQLGPDASGVGWVYQYALVDDSGKHSLADLRALQDFSLRYWLASVEGVAEVAPVGGFVKEYQIHLDPNKLASYGISLAQVRDAVRRSNNDVGGQTLEIAGYEHFVRGRGYIRSPHDLETIPLGLGKNGVAIRLRDVAQVTLGPAMRRGLAELDGQGEAVGGIVVMRQGEDALGVIAGVKRRITEIQASLPAGVRLVTTYDRSQLIERAAATLKRTLIEEALVVSLVIAVFLLHLRSALIAILTLPVAILLSFIPMVQQHLGANIMSLGGVAVAIGAMVDASIVMIENVHRHLEQWERDGRSGARGAVIVTAMQEVGPSIFFSLLIITVSFLPVFALQGAEGRLFHPLAYTKSYAMGFSALLAVTFTPALALLLIRGKIRGDRSLLNRALVALYNPVVRWCVRWRWAVIALFAAMLVATVPVLYKLQSEFMPSLNEGTILYMPSSLPGLSVTQAGKILQTMDRELMNFPEVERVFGKIGRADTATDPAPMSMVETLVTLKPQEQWRPGMTWDSLIAEMDEKLRFPGMPNVWWMPIQTRTEMLNTGIRSNLGLKVYGADLNVIEDSAVKIERALNDDPRTKPYTRSAFAERLRGGYYVDFNIRREDAARYGLTVGDVEDTILTAIGGVMVTQTVEGRARYAVNLRYARDWREDPETLKRVLVPTPTGAQIPLAQLADLEFVTGPPMLRSEDGQLVGYVFIDVNEKIGLADYVNAARAVIAAQANPPAGYRMAWSGQYQYFERAKERLKFAVPLTLLIIFIMLYMSNRSVVETLLILLTVPVSLTGAIWLLYWLGYKLSVAAWVGMIALAGLDAELGVLMMLYLNIACRQRIADGTLNTFSDLVDAIMEGAARRIRPKLMTGAALLAGLVPILWSTGTGADVMKRIAAPMVGGIATTLLMVLLLYPALFAVWKKRQLPKTAEGGINSDA